MPKVLPLFIKGRSKSAPFKYKVPSLKRQPIHVSVIMAFAEISSVSEFGLFDLINSLGECPEALETFTEKLTFLGIV